MEGYTISNVSLKNYRWERGLASLRRLWHFRLPKALLYG
jgi:hypothetical protein